MLVKSLSEMHEEQEHKHGAQCSCGCDHGHDHKSSSLGIAFLGGILVLNSYIAQTFFSTYIDKFAIELSAVIGALILGVPIVISAIGDLVKGKVYMNELVALALVASVAQKDFRTAGAVAFFMLITIMIESKTAKGAESSIESLVKLTPRDAHLLKDGEETEVDALELKLDDVVRVRPGENFPADGIIITGESTVNQSSITGESLPVDKAKDDEVFAGTQNLTGMVEVKVTRVGTDTTLGKVRDLIMAAEGSKLPIMRMIDQYIVFYTPTILMVAAMVWAFTGQLDRVIAILVMSCPCALVISTPSANIAAIAAAARLGILIKDVSHIELASKIKSIIFDKTGTLTEGNLEVARLQPADGVELSELLLVATSTESHSNHPAAQAMKRLAKEAGVKWDEPEKYEEVAGKGVEAKFSFGTCCVGRESWMIEQGMETSVMHETLHESENDGSSIIFVAKDKKIIGWIGLRDAIRSVSKETISNLKDLGIKNCSMVTGDNKTVAELVAQKIGIAFSRVKAACLPQEKVDYVEEQRKAGDLVAVVGDGVNDAPALAAGDIGIAMGAIGSDVAVQSASIALMNNDLRRIPFLISMSRKTRVIMRQNLIAGFGFIITGLYFSSIGLVTPVIAALIHSGSTLFVLFNSARLVRSGEALQASDNQE